MRPTPCRTFPTFEEAEANGNEALATLDGGKQFWTVYPETVPSGGYKTVLSAKVHSFQVTLEQLFDLDWVCVAVHSYTCPSGFSEEDEFVGNHKVAGVALRLAVDSARKFYTERKAEADKLGSMVDV